MSRANKHNARRHTATVGGQLCHFDSLAEHRYADWLERERKAGRVGSWEFHPDPIIVDGNGDRELVRLEVDFAVVIRSNKGVHVEWHEVKGMATAAWRIKRKVLQAQWPWFPYIVIDAGRGVCATGVGEPALFDERPRRKAKRRKR